MDLNTMIALMAASIYPALKHDSPNDRAYEAVEIAKLIWHYTLKADG